MANIRRRVPNSLHLPSGMVDPRDHKAIPPSQAELKGQRNFALHPATSARVRDIHRASVIRMASIYNASTKRHPREGTAALPYAENLASAAQAIYVTTTPSRAGGHGGPPLPGDFGICSASDIRDNHAITCGRTRRSAPRQRIWHLQRK
jgi:hypothetical protein